MPTIFERLFPKIVGRLAPGMTVASLMSVVGIVQF
jgi:hypothetical protein